MDVRTDHKVHFTEEESDSFEDHSRIIVQSLEGNKYSVHLGFLKLNHYYEIVSLIPHDLGDLQFIQEPPNVFAKVLDVQPHEQGGSEIKVEFFAHKEKLLKELLKFEAVVDPTKRFTVVLNARILGKGKGHPSLKLGIRCIGSKADDESEASDWQGFE